MNSILRCCAAAFGVLVTVSVPPGSALDETALNRLRAQALAIASEPGEDLHNVAWLCNLGKGNIEGRRDNLVAGGDPLPGPVFDNLYFVGTGHVSAWAVTTSAGIILFDTLDNPQEADQFILGGLKRLGLNPADIKYIVITHAHADHYGGARELQAKIPGVHVLMDPRDWDVLAKSPPVPKPGTAAAPLPKRDMDVSDGQKLTLGGETIRLYATPGHTPGTISAIIPVTDHGKAMNVALWGGIPFTSKESEPVFMASLQRFRAIMAANHVVGRISNHAIWDNSISKLYAKTNNPEGPSPYIETSADMKRYGEIQDICLKALHIRRVGPD